MDYKHNQMIHRLFREAKIQAWATLRSDIDVIRLKAAYRKERAARLNTTDNPEKSRAQYDEVNELLQMTNR